MNEKIIAELKAEYEKFIEGCENCKAWEHAEFKRDFYFFRVFPIIEELEKNFRPE